MLRAQAGESKAFGELATAVTPVLLAQVRALVRHDDDARLLVEETLVRMWKARRSFDAARASVHTWAGRIARNLALDHLRRRKRRAVVSLHTLAEAEPAVRPDLDPLSLATACDEVAALRQALARLGPRERVAVELRFCEDLAFREVAERMQLPLGSAATLVYRGLRKLRSALRPCLGKMAA